MTYDRFPVLQPLLMVCFLALFLRDAITRPLLSPWVSPGEGAAISLALMAALAITTHVLIWRRGRRLSRTGNPREVRRADLAVGATWVIATGLHVFNILGLGWLDAVRGVVGNTVILDEVLALLPVVLVIVAAWWSLYPIDRRVREAGLVRDLDEGKAVYPHLSRWQYVVMAVRHHLAIILVPILLITAWSELVDWAADAWFGIRIRQPSPDGSSADLLVVLVQAAGTIGVFTLMPPIMRRVWETEPLGTSPIRDRLDALCRRNGVRNRELLVWKTHGTMINGAVMGIFAPVRYILLTDSLLDHLTDSQVEAVMAHEVGHVCRKHMIWLGVAIIGAFGCVLGAAGLALQAFEVSQTVGDIAAIPATLAALAIATILFGFVSRRFEWQADAFAVQHLSRDQPTPSTTITPEAVAAMNGALQAVAQLNHIPPDRFSWRHGSILARQQRLAALVGLPLDGLPVDRTARTVKLLSGVGLLAAAALFAAQAF